MWEPKIRENRGGSGVRSYRILASLLSLFVFLSCAGVAYAGFGISPPYVNNDRLTRGSTYTQTIMLVRSDPTDDLNVEISTNVKDADSWISIDPGDKFVLHKNVTQMPLKITIHVPQDAKYASYGGSIRIRTSPISADAPAGGVSIALGAQVDVNLKVVDKIYEFTVRRIRLGDTEEGRIRLGLFFPGKIRFFITVQNTGNTDFGPSKACLDIYDSNRESLLEHTCNTNRLEKVPAFATKEIVAELPTRLTTGLYSAKYTIYKNSEIAQQNQLALSIVPVGSVAGYAGYGFSGLSTADKIKALTWIGVPLILLVILIIVILSARKRRIKNYASRR